MANVKRVPTQFVISAFTKEDTVDDIEKAVMDMEFESKQVLCTNMAVVKKDIAGKLSIKEMGSPSALQRHDKRVGSLVGGLALMMMGQAGSLEGQKKGGAISTVAAENVQGMDKEKLHELGDALLPGCSAIVLVFDEVFIDKEKGEAFLAEYKASTETLVGDIAAKVHESLKKGCNITYQIAIDEDGVTATREIIGENAANFTEILLTPDAAAIHRRVISPELYASTRAAMTGSLCMYTTRTITEDEMQIEAGIVHDTSGSATMLE
jgi:uncharacterized membrane protein